jgi:prophage regulatory protein
MSQIVRLKELIVITGLSRSTLHRMEALGGFVARRRLGLRAVGWERGEVEAWLASRKRVTMNCKDGPRSVQP